MRILMLLVLAVPALGFTTCDRRPNVPEQVTVVVERYKPLPAWATEPLPTWTTGPLIEDSLRSDAARGVIVDLANCHRRLLARLDRGEAVDKSECGR